MSHCVRKAAVIGLAVCWALAAVANDQAATKQAAAKPAKVVKKAEVANCRFPDYRKQKAPLWVCGQAPKDLALSAVGSASKSKGGVQHVKELATANARLKLARQVSERIEQRANRRAKAQGVTLAQAGRVITKTLEKRTQEELVGSRIIESITSRRGVMYVLVALDEQSLRESVLASVKAGIALNPAPWKPLLTGSSADQLASALADD